MSSISIHLDNRTKKIIDDYAGRHSISRSSVIKLAVHEFFLKTRGKHDF